MRQPITIRNETELRQQPTFGPQLDFTLVFVMRFFRAETIFKRSFLTSVNILERATVRRGTMRMYVYSLFLVATFLHFPCNVLATGLSISSRSSAVTKADLWERRVNTSIWLLQNKPCKFFTSSGNCSELKSRARSSMILYTASSGDEKLVAVSPDKIKLVPTSYKAVVVLDPYPLSSFGHPVLVFFIEPSTQSDCNSNRKSTFTRKLL